MPQSWDPPPPAPSAPAFAEGTERVPLVDDPADDPADTRADAPAYPRADAGDLGERTIVMSGAYELRPRFTGRAGALARLLELTDRAFDQRELGFAVVLGEPGMGKSRLVGELCARVRAAHPSVLVLSGLADENAPTYGPISRALAARFGVTADVAPDAARERILAGVAEVMPAARVTEVAHLVAHLLRVPFADSPVVEPLLDSPQRLEARLFLAIRRYLVAEAERRPALLVVENLELCGNDTINFLQYLAAGVREHRLAIVGTATAALHERHPAFGDGEVPPAWLELGALSAAEAEELFRELSRSVVELPPRLVDHVRALGGSPRAILELVRLLLESDVYIREGILWRVEPRALAALRLPRTYDEIVAARLAVMDEAERRVLEMAAVVGEVAWLDAILALERHGQRTDDPDGPTLAQIAASGDHSRARVVAAIGKLVEREWLLEDGRASIAGERELRFAYSNLWAIVYHRIDDARRRTYHGVVARWLELHPDGGAPAAQEEIARHLALAGEPREAASRYRRSAEAARAQFQNERAIRLFDRALACLGSRETGDLAARLHVWHDLGSVYELIGDLEAALGAFERMLRLSWVAASKTKAGVAYNKIGRVWRRKGDLARALDYLGRGLELFRAAGDQRGIAGSLDDIGKALHLLGRYDEAFAKITEALALRGKGGDQRAIATSLSRLGEVQRARGQYEPAHRCYQEALALRQAAGDRWGGVVSRNDLAALAFELGELADARAGWQAALADAEAMGALPLCAMILTNLGELAIAEGKLEEARRRLDDALELIEDTEDSGLESACCRHLAALEKLHGQTAAARALAERALGVAQAAGLRDEEALAYLTLGDVLAANLYDASADATTPNPAAAALGRAIEILRGIHHEAALGKALLALGRYKVESGELAEGKDLIRDAIMLFSKLGLARPAADAEQLLASVL